MKNYLALVERQFSNLGLFRIWLSLSILWVAIFAIGSLATKRLESYVKTYTDVRQQFMEECIDERLQGEEDKRRLFPDYDFTTDYASKYDDCANSIDMRQPSLQNGIIQQMLAWSFVFLSLPVISFYFALSTYPKHIMPAFKKYAAWIRDGFENRN